MPKRLVFAGLVLLAGCGEYTGESVKTYPVTGKVMTTDETPLTSGSVVFVPVATSKTARAAAGAIKSDGTYSLVTANSGSGAAEGDYHIRIETSDTGAAAGLPKKGMVVKGKVAPEYGDEDLSGLTFTVEPKPNTYDITLKAHLAAPKKAANKVRD
jgi:hypothetical protein